MIKKFFSSRSSDYHAAASAAPPPLPYADRWQIIRIYSISLLELNMFANWHNTEMASNHHAFRKFFTVSSHAACIAMTSICLCSTEAILRFSIAATAIAIAPSCRPRFQQLLHNTATHISLTALDNIVIAAAGCMAAYQCFTKASNIHIVDNVVALTLRDLAPPTLVVQFLMEEAV